MFENNLYGAINKVVGIITQVNDEKEISEKEDITYLVTHRIDTTEKEKGYIQDLEHFLLNLFFRNEFEIVHSSVLEDIVEEIEQLIPEGLVKECMRIVLYRCLAQYYFSDSCEVEDIQIKSLLLSNAQTCYENTVQFPSELISDYGVTGYVYLALFHSITGDTQEALSYLTKAIFERRKNRLLWILACINVFLPASRNGKPLPIIRNDPLSHLMQLECDNVTAMFSPIAFASYLFYRIPGDQDFISIFPKTVQPQGLGGTSYLYQLLMLECGDVEFFNEFADWIERNSKQSSELLETVKNVLSTDEVGVDRIDLLLRVFPVSVLYNHPDPKTVSKVLSLVAYDIFRLTVSWVIQLSIMFHHAMVMIFWILTMCWISLHWYAFLASYHE